MVVRLAHIAVALAVALCSWGCRSAVARPITTPSGAPGYAIECKRNQTHCFEMAGQVCPSGYQVLEDARDTEGVQVTSSTLTGVNVDKKFGGQLMIVCNGDTAADPAAASERDAPPQRKAATEPPTGALGVRFGSKLDEFSSACEVAGNKYQMRPNGGYCSGLIKSTDFPAAMAVTSCEGAICYILIDAKFSAVGDSEVPRVIGLLREQLLARYGTPSTVRFEVPTECGNSLAECLKQGRAHVGYLWTWESGQVVNLSATTTGILLGYGTHDGVQAMTAEGL